MQDKLVKLEETLSSREKLISELIKQESFSEYDLKKEITKNYEKIEIPECIEEDYKKLSSSEKRTIEKAKTYNEFIERINKARTEITKLNKNYIEYFKKDDEFDFIYLRRYLLFKYQYEKAEYDCDTSYPVYQFYRDNGIYDANLGKGIPQYFDTYLSVQTLWGQLIRNLYKKEYDKIKESENKKEASATDKKKRNVNNDFEWQITHFDDILTKDLTGSMKDLFEALNNFAHYYHTIGNIAPCPSRINGPKGFAINCYDRIDLFLTNEVIKEWLNWYYKDSIVLQNYSENTEKYQLDFFLNPENLSKKVVIPKNKDDEQNIKDLINYINNIIDIIKKRSKALKKLY